MRRIGTREIGNVPCENIHKMLLLSIRSRIRLTENTWDKQGLINNFYLTNTLLLDLLSSPTIAIVQLYQFFLIPGDFEFKGV
jgi:hypothetical protein